MLLITGITGHSGRYFLNELSRNAYAGPIRCIVREASDTAEIDNVALDIAKAVGDLDDQEFLDTAMSGVHTVVHIASIFHSRKVVRAAVKNGVRRIILVHTTGIYSKHKSASEEYVRIEHDIAQFIEDEGSTIGVVYLRPTMIYGYLNDRNMCVFIRMVKRLRVFPVINGGRSLVQPVHGSDLGSAYYAVLSHSDIECGDYILSGEAPVSMRELLQLISDALGKRTTFVSVPLGVGVILARVLKLITIGRVDYVERVQRMGEDRSFSHADATRDFMYSPMCLADGVRAEVAEYERCFK